MEHDELMERDERFALWYTEHHDRIRAMCARMLRDPAAAEDIAQETLLRAWLGRDRMREEDLGAWLTVVARNLCISHARRQKRVVLTDDLPETPDESADPARAVERMESRRAVRRAMRQVGERHRVLLFRREVEEVDYEELGAELGLTAGGTRAVLFRARRVLRDRLAAAGEGLGAWIFGVKVKLNRMLRSNPPLTDATATAALQAGLSIALAVGLTFGGTASTPEVGSISGRGAGENGRIESVDRTHHELPQNTDQVLAVAQPSDARRRERDVTGPVTLNRRGTFSAPVPGSKGLLGTGYEVGVWKEPNQDNPLPYDGSKRQEAFDLVVERACSERPETCDQVFDD